MYKSISPRIAGIVMVLVYIANAYILGNDRIAGRNSWLCVLISAILFIPIYILFYFLTKKYPGLNFFEIVNKVCGKTVMKIIAVIYVVYAICVLSMSYNCFARFVSSNILQDTPKYVMGTAIALCAAYLVWKGGVVMGKWASFVLPVVLIFILISLLGSIPSLHFEYLLPFAENWEDIAVGTYRYLAFPVGEPILFFSLLSSVKGDFRLRHWLIPLAIAAAILSFAFARDTMVLGGSLSGVLSFSTNHADSIAGYLNYSQRTEVLTSLIPAAAGIMEAAVTLFFITQGVDAVIEKSNSWIGILIGTIAGLAISFTVYNTSAALEKRYMVWPAISVAFQVAVPLMCLLVSSVKSGMRRKILARRLKRQMM